MIFVTRSLGMGETNGLDPSCCAKTRSEIQPHAHGAGAQASPLFAQQFLTHIATPVTLGDEGSFWGEGDWVCGTVVNPEADLIGIWRLVEKCRCVRRYSQ